MAISGLKRLAAAAAAVAVLAPGAPGLAVTAETGPGLGMACAGCGNGAGQVALRPAYGPAGDAVFAAGPLGWMPWYSEAALAPRGGAGSGGKIAAAVLVTVPLPASLPLLLAGVAGIALIGWRRRIKAQRGSRSA